jgi:hypothetical protein
MLVTAIMLRKIDGLEGRKLYTGGPSARVLRRTLALASRLEREAGLWEGERRAELNAVRRARTARLEKARAKGSARVAA